MNSLRFQTFLLGVSITFGVNWLLMPITLSYFADWKFHVLHALVAALIGWFSELVLRRRLGLRCQWSILGNPEIKQFGIYILIWIICALLSFHDVKIPYSRSQMLTYSASSFLFMSTLVITFNLLTKEKNK